MDADLKQYLEEMEVRLRAEGSAMEARLLAHAEAMEGRLRADGEEMEVRLRAEGSAMEARLLAHTEAMETRLLAHTEALETRLRGHVSEQCEKIETRLLTEFHKWGSTSDIRTRTAMTDTALLGERMLIVEDRVTALERQRRVGGGTGATGPALT